MPPVFTKTGGFYFAKLVMKRKRALNWLLPERLYEKIN